MLTIIRKHNGLNGFVFTIAEFGGLATLLLPFVIYYWSHERWPEAIIATGIVVNCATVCVTAARQRRLGGRRWAWRRCAGRSSVTRSPASTPR